MPTSINNLECEFNIKVTNSIKWGMPFIENSIGVYVITTNKDKRYIPYNNIDFSLNDGQIELWLKNASDISLNDRKVQKEHIKNHLLKFWLPDETILYIGKAEKQTLSERICQFYNHKVGNKSPHKGGYWLKLLSELNNFYIHLIPNDNPHLLEEQMLKYFIQKVSIKTKNNLLDKELCLPFANLQLKSRVIKKHGLKNHTK